jgi:hypothetical protein
MPNESDKELWSAKDDRSACELNRINSGGKSRWVLEITEGNFRGYPNVDLTFEDLEKLFVAIRNELYPDRWNDVQK